MSAGTSIYLKKGIFISTKTNTMSLLLLSLTQTLTTDSIINTLLSYGVLGVFSIAAAYVAWGQYKRLLEKNDSLELKVDAMQKQIQELLVEDRNRMERLVSDNTKAIESLHSIIVDTLVAVRVKTK
jgi:hypothetical protein